MRVFVFVMKCFNHSLRSFPRHVAEINHLPKTVSMCLVLFSGESTVCCMVCVSTSHHICQWRSPQVSS